MSGIRFGAYTVEQLKAKVPYRAAVQLRPKDETNWDKRDIYIPASDATVNTLGFPQGLQEDVYSPIDNSLRTAQRPFGIQFDENGVCSYLDAVKGFKIRKSVVDLRPSGGK